LQDLSGGGFQGLKGALPKLLLERSYLADEVELEAQDYQIVIRSTKPPRQNWEVAFRAMAERGHDAYSTDLC
jgi:antitoxin MazE